MSNWTHVAGIVRIDFIRFEEISEQEYLDAIDEIFGKEYDYDSPRELWEEAGEHPEEFLPAGSEGSLHKSMWLNPDKSCMAAMTVSIFGDLRDHDSPGEIIEWFKGKCENEDLMIRNAVITVENEWNGTRTWVYDRKKNK